MSTPTEILQSAYTQAQQVTSSPLLAIQQARVEIIIASSESHKAILTVVITSCVKKIENPRQDIRQHKIELSNGYSGRSYDFNYITPFLQEHFPRYAMAESGWLTRSIEQPHAFTLDFPGKIRNQAVKKAFLEILNDIETQQTNPTDYLIAIFAGLLKHQQSQQIPFTRQVSPDTFTVHQIIGLLEQHFFTPYQGAGASRLPVLALYALYELLMPQPRYATKHLAILKSHTTADVKSASLGDIEVLHADATFFEVVEVKHGKPITPSMLRLAYEKFRSHPIARYYLLTTHDPNTEDSVAIQALIHNIRGEHGCEVIVNGVMFTLKYYLRLLDNPDRFIEYYTAVLQKDYAAGTDIKQTHLVKWQELLG